MGEGEKYNFYVHSDIKEKVVIINIYFTFKFLALLSYHDYVCVRAKPLKLHSL